MTFKKLVYQNSWRAIGLGILSIAIALIIILIQEIQVAANPLNISGGFTQKIVGTSYYLFDLGVADVNQDGWLDIFTTNHGAKQSLAIADGRGNFQDSLAQNQLSQSTNFPGAEPSTTKPTIAAAGLYIYWHQTTLNIEAKDVVADEICQLRFMENTTADKIRIKQADNFTAKIQEISLNSGEKQVAVDFTVSGSGKLVIETAAPVSTAWQLKAGFPLEKVYVGADSLVPTKTNFVLSLKDRHGMAWADYDGDRDVDVYITRGGMSGKMKQLAPEAKDELLTNNGQNFDSGTIGLIPRKHGCPGRQVAWVDINQDNLLDVYLVCGRGSGDSELLPNQLQQQQPEGNFIEVASQWQIDLPGVGVFAWLDSDSDGDLDLLWAGRTPQELWLYVNHQGKFQPEQISSIPGRPLKMTIADYDNDGDLDVFTVTNQGNVIINNQNGRLKAIAPQKLGLPAKAIDANWVDYDNDGLNDLHALPGGIYLQQNNHTFSATKLLGLRDSSQTELVSSWVDFDNDGWRDLLLASRQPTPPWQKAWRKLNPPSRLGAAIHESKIAIYHNPGQDANWLELKLIGNSANSSAIGSKVILRTDKQVQTQQIGQAEGSLFSQGHYRLYFGLGRERAKSIEILWSDGTTQTIVNPPVNRLLTIKQSV